MKKIICMCICLILLFPIKINAEETMAKNAQSAYVMEYSTKKAVFTKNENERLYPASMTKMMGLILIFEALNNHRIEYEDEITASAYASSMGGSQIFLAENEKMSVMDLLKSICIASANDAIVAMGEALYGSESEFVNAMNEKAEQLNLENTNFINCTGLHHPDHYSSAKDMAIIAHTLLEVGQSKLLEITSTYEDYIREDNEKFWLVNTNKLISQYEGVDGLKTGYTNEALSCICVSAKRNNLRFIVVVMKEPDSKIRNEEVKQLLNYSFSLFDTTTLYKKGKKMKTIIDPFCIEESYDLVCEDDITLITNKNEKINIVSQEIEMLAKKYPYKKNDRIAKLHLQLSNGETHTSYLVCTKKLSKKNVFQLFLDVFKYVI